MIAAALLLAGTARFDCVVAGPGGHVAADLLAARLDERRGRPIPRGRCRRMLLVARTAKVAAALPRALRARWRDAAPVSRSAEGYAVRRLGSVTVIAAQGTRGLVYGAGWALRAWRGPGTLAMGAQVDAAPAYPARLTQIGYRAKNNSYDAWTLAMFRRRTEDLALWGASGVQVIAPVSDDAVRYPLQLYPDIAHTMHAQFPVDRWHPAFALSEGREPIDPRPIAFAAIFRRLAPLSRGFVTYSEGVNDDANQYLWMRLGWTPGADPAALMADYGRVVMGDARAGALAMALERDWVGDPARNAGIDQTRALADALRGTGWQADSLGYRANYDALVRVRLIAARARDAAATTALARGDADAAIAAYATPDGDAAQVLRTRLFALAARLYAQARLQLSVPLYGASGTERGANLDRADVPLDDRAWLAPRIAAARGDPAALADLADHARAREGALYDDLGDPDHEPHLVRGTGLAADPQGFATAIDGIADRTPADGWRLSEISYAETLYDAPLRLHYTGLDPARGYRLVAAWAGEDYALPMRLVANGSVALHPFRARRANPETFEVAIPHALTAGGTLDLAWSRPPGLGGSGRGHQIAETWLIPEGTTP
ncbi:hypothetical protein [Sphingomonas sp. GC_Shp_6]|uniref:hypothetical protein n=1 Tax=Sphingomonas sp. GC_Shp_6 TaxID=2937378 RepID=UPI00226A44B2|nr:hypothetical protein [Sphingomonas sp. GC_Shp_6]